MQAALGFLRSFPLFVEGAFLTEQRARINQQALDTDGCFALVTEAVLVRFNASKRCSNSLPKRGEKGCRNDSEDCFACDYLRRAAHMSSTLALWA